MKRIDRRFPPREVPDYSMRADVGRRKAAGSTRYGGLDPWRRSRGEPYGRSLAAAHEEASKAARELLAECIRHGEDLPAEAVVVTDYEGHPLSVLRIFFCFSERMTLDPTAGCYRLNHRKRRNLGEDPRV